MMSFRLFVVVVTACLGGFMFGYDTGFIGAATTMPSFQKDFGITTENKADVSGNVVATLQAGCFFGVIAMAFLTDRIGRRLALILSGVLFNAGAILQTASKGNVGVFYGGRVISGLGVGSASMLAPTFISEMSPKKVRGMTTMAFGFSIFISIAIAYWVDYACQQRLEGSAQWIVPTALQFVPGTAMILGMIPLRESPRYLARRGKRHEAYETLVYLRQKDQSLEETNEEFAEISDSVDRELEESQGVKLKEIFSKGIFNRFLLAIALMIAQQLSGTLSFTYYAPVFFEFVGLDGVSTGLFATGVYGIVKSVATIIGIFFLIERLGRKWSLLVGAAGMGAVMLIIGCIYATLPPQTDGSISAASYAMIVMIYIYCVFYAVSWGPVPWTYASEIFPTRVREYGVTTASATQWAFNYCMSRVIPIAVENIKWRVFIMFAVFNFANAVFTFFFVKETAGKSLEEMEALFGAPTAIDVNDSHQRAAAIIANAEEQDIKTQDFGHVERVSSRA